MHIYDISATTAGSDYSPVTRIVTFPSGVNTASLSISIMDDSIVEPTELFSARLITTEPNVVIGGDTATITIQDNDGEIIVHTLFNAYL